MFKKKWIWGLLVLAGVSWGVFYFFSVSLPRPTKDVTPSLPQGNYQSYRSSHALATLDPQFDHTWEIVPRDEHFEKADERNPIYWNGRKPEARFLKGRRALIVSTGKALQAWDLDQSDWIWKVELPEENRGSPVLDPETGIIYLSARNWDRFEETRIIELFLFAVHIEGQLLYQKQIPATFWSSPVDHPLHGKAVPRINCHTSMGLNLLSEPKQLFMGCAIRTLPQKAGYRYRDDRGVTGRVLVVDLDDSGDFAALRQFYTSRWSDDPNHGFDSGVYNSGSGPTLLDDGSLLVVTGNGLADSQAGNFGCSVVRIDTKSVEPVMDSQGKPLSFSLSPEPYQECWSQNWDLGSSGVAAQQVLPGRWIGGVMSKHADIFFFDPDRMNQQEGRIYISEAARDSYGSPASRNLGDGRAQFLVQFTTFPNYRSSSSFLGTKEILEKTEGVFGRRCLGWVAKSSEKFTRSLELMYSGPLLKRYTYAFVGSEESQLRSQTFNKVRVGWHSAWANPKLKVPFQPHGQLGHFWTTPELSGLERLEFSDFVSELRNETFPEVYYFPVEDEEECENEVPEKRQALYLIEQNHREKTLPGLHVQSYVVDSELKWQRTWDFRAEDLLIHQTSMSMWTVPDTGEAYVASLVVEPETSKAQLLILKADTGELIERKTLPDITHFAMPMAIDDFLVIPTRSQGLFIYKFSLTAKGEEQRWKHLFFGQS